MLHISLMVNHSSYDFLISYQGSENPSIYFLASWMSPNILSICFSGDKLSCITIPKSFSFCIDIIFCLRGSHCTLFQFQYRCACACVLVCVCVCVCVLFTMVWRFMFTHDRQPLPSPKEIRAHRALWVRLKPHIHHTSKSTCSGETVTAPCRWKILSIWAGFEPMPCWMADGDHKHWTTGVVYMCVKICT